MAGNISILLCVCALLNLTHTVVSVEFLSVLKSRFNCWPHGFKCNNDECIQATLTCDGKYDCEDHSDEFNCPEVTTPATCSSEHFRCSDGTCISIDWYCDGKNDCPDSSDEVSDCYQNKTKCADNKFMCSNRRCVPKAFQCDGENDCRDNSDEEHCPPRRSNINTTDCVLAKRLFACKNKLKCINIKEVCDGVQHCQDNSDEADGCQLARSELKHCNCSHDCAPTPDGAVCLCPSGYELRRNVCEDMNECDIYGTCDQICTNLPGNYKCSCEADYFLLPDERSCKATGPEGLLFYSTMQEIKAVYLDSLKNYTVAVQVAHVTGVASDGKHMYWTTITEGSPAIVRSNQDGSHIEQICTTGLGIPEDLEVDWITSNIYFTDVMMKQIGVCTNDGSSCTILHNRDIDKPRAITLASEYGLMFWTDWGAKPLIARSNMDGSDGVELVAENIHWPNGITSDMPSKRLYWIDAKIQIIETIKFDGTDRRAILQDFISHPYSVAVFDTMLYWSDWEGKEILSCNKLTGKDRRSIVREPMRKIFGINVYHPILNRTKLINPCTNANCSDICLIRPATHQDVGLTHACACADDKYLLEDGKTCYSVNLSNILFAGYEHYLHVISNEHIGHQKSTDVLLGNIESISALVYDSIVGRLLISDAIQKKIFAYDLNTLSLSTVTDHRIGSISIMDFDDHGNNLFWCNTESMSIEVLSLTTSKHAVVFHGSAVENPMSLAVVPENGIMFVATLHSFSSVHIDMLPMVGSLARKRRVIENLIGPVVSLHYCRSLKRLFWTDLTSGLIESVDSEGNDRQLFIHTQSPISLTSLHNEIFWIKKGISNIYHKYEREEKSIKLNIQGFNGVNDVKITAIKKFDLNLNHPCHTFNGHCDGLCIPSVVSYKQMCACPDGLSLASNGLDCVKTRTCTSHEYRCSTGECIPLINLCNKQEDCPRGDDELPDKCDAASCPAGQFLCSNKEKCIDHSLVCNGRYDCKDRSDEVCYVNCSTGKYLCKSGDCIDNQFLCNGNADCPGGDDEYNCSSAKCLSSEFRCKSGQCIYYMFECDGDVDCADGTDEHSNCKKAASEKCSLFEFRCNNERCVDFSVTCNGRDDCGDNSDEGEHCNRLIGAQSTNIFYPNHQSDWKNDEVHKMCNPSTEFQCNFFGVHCLPISARCNDKIECPNGEDELGCQFSACPSLTEFRCQQTKQCIPREWLCDRVNDCNDKSDEDPTLCSSGYTNRTIVDVDKQCGGFLCLDGACIDVSKVCNGIADCNDKSDEGNRCGENCENVGCSHRCRNLPTGPQCYCDDGYRLIANDSKICRDIDECELEICAQICVNTEGSFHCSCFTPAYVLRSDRISCKAVGDAMLYVILSDYSIYTISHNLHHLDRIYYAPNRPKLNYLSVDAVRNYVYWSSSSGLIARFLLNDTDSIQYVSEIDNPGAITVDWVVGNIYYVEAVNGIGICNFDTKKCSKLYTAGKGKTISAIIVDSRAGYVFWNEITFNDTLVPISVVKRADCSGANVRNLTDEMPTVIENLAIDPFKYDLYFLNRSNNSLVRITYNGLKTSTMFEVGSETVTFEHFENSLYWSTDDNSNYPLRKCKVHGLPPRNCELVPIHTPPITDFTIYQQNKYPIVDNPCAKTNCTHICVSNPTGAVCLCRDGDIIDPGRSCEAANKFSEAFNDNPVKSTANSKSGTNSFISSIIVILMLVIGVVFVYYRFFRSKSTMFEKFHFRNTTHGNCINEDQPVLQQQFPVLVPGKHTYENPMTENISLFNNQQMNGGTKRISNNDSPAVDCNSELDYTSGCLETYQAPLINGQRT